MSFRKENEKRIYDLFPSTITWCLRVLEKRKKNEEENLEKGLFVSFFKEKREKGKRDFF